MCEGIKYIFTFASVYINKFWRDKQKWVVGDEDEDKAEREAGVVLSCFCFLIYKNFKSSMFCDSKLCLKIYMRP